MVGRWGAGVGFGEEQGSRVLQRESDWVRIGLAWGRGRRPEANTGLWQQVEDWERRDQFGIQIDLGSNPSSPAP